MFVFINDILVYSENEKEHAHHFSVLLQTLKDRRLYEKFSKCEVWPALKAFLGHIVFGYSIRVDT